jgi:circadian clock protein KaiC
MREDAKATIHLLPSGVPGLDAVLGGGIPEYSFNLVAGQSGGGKTTLAQQIAFGNATPERTALYFTILGETPIKMLRYQQQYSFFDAKKLDESIRFVNVSREVLEGTLDDVLETITREVEAADAGLVVVDSFRTLVHSVGSTEPVQGDLQTFVQSLALHLTSWQTTSFLVGEYHERERDASPVFTIADGILWLTQAIERNAVVRKLQVVKMRGRAQMPGLHNFRITDDGIRVFPRISLATEDGEPKRRTGRITSGVPALDRMMGGGIPAGDSILVAGPSGTGKSTLASQFIGGEGARESPSVLVTFEERPEAYLARAEGFGLNLRTLIDAGTLEVIYLRPLDLSPDETLHEIREAVRRLDAERVVIDSLSGFELALASTFRQEFRESLYRLVGALTGRGITVMTTMEVSQDVTGLRFTPNLISFLADDVVLLRYVEMHGELRKVLAVAKMRRSDHSKAFREYRITARGVELGEELRDYRGTVTGASEITLPEG